MRIDVRPGSSRFVTSTDWVESHHSFSFGPHYDPDNVGFGLLVAHNDELLQPGAGFPEHSHRGVDIVTWVVAGALRHDDGTGASGVVRPGFVQCLRAGTGVKHCEANASGGVTRYLQMWIAADGDQLPDYTMAEVHPGEGGFAPVASGHSPAPITLRHPKAVLLAAHLRAGDSVPLPAAAFVHLYIVEGAVLLGDVPLLTGDAARITDAGSGTDAAGAAQTVVADAESLLLAWLMEAEPWRPPPG